jgi:energy-coupling factor transport system ATP-binding protein
VIQCENVSFTYPSDRASDGLSQSRETLRNISCTIEDGSFVLLCGSSGCGKTTLTRLFNGLIPHYYEGDIAGRALIDGVEYKDLSLFDISKKVGSVFQNPRSQFFNVDTTGEIAFGPENHGMPKAEVIRRIRQVSEQLNLVDLLGRSIFSLSGGEKQKIACGSAAALGPEVYVLDEPSSNLDACAIVDFRKLLTALKAQGKTIVIAEHRLHYLYDLVDRVIYLQDGEIKGDFAAQEFWAITDSQRDRMGLRPFTLASLKDLSHESKRTSDEAWAVQGFCFSYRNSQKEALHIEDAALACGKVTAIIGHNGAGKTTFSRCMCGLEKRCKGTLARADKTYDRRQRLKLCYLVMQDVNHQLFTESVLDEVLLSMCEEDTPAAELILNEMDLLTVKHHHPMGLSGGQKQRVAIASALASKRPILLFDEPTSGLDLFHMRQVAIAINRLVDSGKTVMVVTHDPEFILRCCDSVIRLSEGHVMESYPLTDKEDRERLLDFFLQTIEATEVPAQWKKREPEKNRPLALSGTGQNPTTESSYAVSSSQF